MTNHIHKKKIDGMAIAVLAGLVVLSGCNRKPTESAATKPELFKSSNPAVRVSPEGIDAAEPAIAASPNGEVYVTWVAHRSDKKADVMIARFTPDGMMKGSPSRVNPTPGTATAWRGDPPTIAIAPDRAIFVGWTSRVEDESGHATNLYLSTSKDLGQSFSAPVKVNDDQRPAVHGMHSLGIGPDGQIYLAWLDERNIIPVNDTIMAPKSAGHHMENNRDVFTSFSVDGGRSFSTNRLVATDACPCCKTTLAVGGDRRVYLSWRQVLPGDYRHIALASSENGGNTFSKAAIVSDDHWMLKGCPVTGAALLPEESGNLRVLWYAAGEKSEPGIYWAESKDGGKTFSPRALLAVNSARGTPALVALNQRNGEVWGVWEANKQGKTLVTAANLAEPVLSDKLAIMADGGELPVAAATSEIYIAYVLKQKETRSIWLTRSSGTRSAL